MTLDAGYARCRDIARRRGTTFFLATRLLPSDRRRHVHALYALARTADDLVDEPVGGSDPATELDRLERAVGEAVRLGSDDPLLAAVADTVRRFAIPPDCFARFFASMRQDLTATSFETWDDLLAYMDGSAAAIGEMMLPLLDPVDRMTALEPARQLGRAFQLTNFLRDVEEDLDRGRQYLPQADLRRFGVELRDRRVDDAFRSLMRFELARCRRLYADAEHGLAELPRRSRLAIGAAHSMYAAILDEIESADHAVWGRRARVPTSKRVRLLVASTVRLWR
ncbi:MAG: phytoene/squalene synthase family protein [Acidimicrobiia bacterium]